jgi:hypothetical protein
LTRDKVPLDWAATQNGLCDALATLDEKGQRSLTLQEAVSACQAALSVFSQEKTSLQWAATKDSLGHALARLGEREAGTDKVKGCTTLKTARNHYAAALEEFRRAGASYYVEKAQGNMARLDGVIARLCG